MGHCPARVASPFRNIQQTRTPPGARATDSDAGLQKWPRLFGRNGVLLKWCLAMFGLRGGEPCGQVVKVDCIWRLAVKRPVRSRKEKKWGALLELAPFERLVGKKEWVAARYRCTLTKPLSSVDVSSVANTQNHNLISLNVKHDTIVADTKSV